MKKHGMVNRLLLLLLAALLLSALPAYGIQVFATEKIMKDETVYGFLRTDGSLREVRVVNRLISPKAGSVVDTGSYLSVRAMVSVPDAEQSPGRITWDLRNLNGKDFYYEGVMEANLPLTADAVWRLNGQEVDATALSGISGEATFTLKLAPDMALQENLRDGFLAQIQVPLDLDKVDLLEADGATRTVVGHTATLVWTLMPGEQGTFIWKGNVTDFSSDPVLISLVKYETSSVLDVSELTDGVKDMETGALSLADGSGALAEGLVDLRSGISAFSAGLTKLSRGASDLSKGMTEYAAGFGAFDAGLTGALDGISRMTGGFVELKASSAQLLAGQESLLAGLAETAAGHARIAQLATALSANPDPMVQQLAGGVLAEKTGLDGLVAGLTKQTEGLRQFHAGLSQAIDGLTGAAAGAGALPSALADMKTGLSKLQAGSRELSAGAAASANGAAKLDDEISPLPDGAKELADGQRELAEGISEIREKTADLIPTDSEASSKVISYADGQTEISTLQFILQLPGVQAPEKAEMDGPRDVRLPWYEEFWKRLTGLFGH